MADFRPTGCILWVGIDTGFRSGVSHRRNEGNEVVTLPAPDATRESDHEFYSQALRFLLGFELLLQTCAIAILMILHVHPAPAFGACAMLFIACRLAVRVCQSRLQPPTTYQQRSVRIV